MKNIFITFIALFCSTLALSAPVKAVAQIPAGKAKQGIQQGDSCDLNRSPLMRCDLYIDYTKSDKRLNDSYRSLLKKLPADAACILRKKQRDWVKFRDETCLNLQEMAACDNALCDGVEHDQCILELTKIRTKELNVFLRNPDIGTRSKYEFEKKYPPASSY